MASDATVKGVRGRSPGEYGRLILRRIGWRAVMAVAVLGFGTPLLGLLLGFRSAAFASAELAAIATMLLIDRKVIPILDRRIRGIDGEKDVGQLLDGLQADGWHTLHNVQTGRGDIDHIVVGPGGILTIETKSRRGRVRVASINPAWLKQAYAQKKFIERLIDVRGVNCLLVFSAAYLDQAVSRQRGVIVLPARMLPGHLRRRSDVLSPEQIERVYDRLAVALDTVIARS
jgi:hypothetical protein